MSKKSITKEELIEAIKESLELWRDDLHRPIGGYVPDYYVSDFEKKKREKERKEQEKKQKRNDAIMTELAALIKID